MATKTAKAPKVRPTAIHSKTGAAILAIGYSLKTLPEVGNEPMPTFQPDSRLKDPEKIQADLRKQQTAYRDNLPRTPLTGTFAEIVVRVLGAGDDTLVRFDTEPVSQFLAWLGQVLPTSFPQTLLDLSRPYLEVSIVTFESRLFLKMLGTRAAITKCACPAGLWFANSKHYDIRDIVMPKDFAALGDNAWRKMLGSLLEDYDLEQYQPGASASDDADLVADGLIGMGLATREQM